MPYPTITTFLHSENGIGPAFDAAVAFAKSHDAHLNVIAPGVDQVDPGYYFAGAQAVVIDESRADALAEARALEALTEERLQGEAIRWDIDSRVVQSPGLADYVAERTRYSDLAFLDAPYGGLREQQEVTVLESVLFRARIPLAVIPERHAGAIAPKRIVIGWNESDEAMCAIRSALPLLHAAQEASIVIVNPPRHAKGRSDPGGALASYLSRHGIASDISVLARTENDVADILIRRAKETGADMIVMGAYGHARLREAIIGGATRHMLERAPLPVFMAH